MARVGHLGPHPHPLQGRLGGKAVGGAEHQPGRVQRRAGHAGVVPPQGGHLPGGGPVSGGALLLHPRPAEIQAGHHGIGGAGGAVKGGGPPQFGVGKPFPGQQQGALPQGGEGLVGRCHRQIGGGEVVISQERQMGPVGSVHHQHPAPPVHQLRQGGKI
ncbi:Uncharacterised protein [Flavonifractor plautii]|uniref:Uncharacterized protein n=1 Tax=Flavonifractor plautii TaxID=292800 RepID=A0A174UG33_FLAPL|nr:Uncharacterised protein [Flavonifractor plautii]